MPLGNVAAVGLPVPGPGKAPQGGRGEEHPQHPAVGSSVTRTLSGDAREHQRLHPQPRAFFRARGAGDPGAAAPWAGWARLSPVRSRPWWSVPQISRK